MNSFHSTTCFCWLGEKLEIPRIDTVNIDRDLFFHPCDCIPPNYCTSHSVIHSAVHCYMFKHRTGTLKNIKLLVIFRFHLSFTDTPIFVPWCFSKFKMITFFKMITLRQRIIIYLESHAITEFNSISQETSAVFYQPKYITNEHSIIKCKFNWIVNQIDFLAIHLLVNIPFHFNSFVLLSFEMVIFEVSMTGAVNMALRPDVKHKIV